MFDMQTISSALSGLHHSISGLLIAAGFPAYLIVSGQPVATEAVAAGGLIGFLLLRRLFRRRRYDGSGGYSWPAARTATSAPARQDYAHRAGAAGERRVARLLDQMSIDHVDDLVFRRPDGGTVQIDCIARLRSGSLVVLETKNYAGQIYGRDGEQYWTHQRKDGSRKQILSPVVQAGWQADAVRQCTGVTPYSVVVTVGKAKWPQIDGVVSLDYLHDVLADLERRGRCDSRAAWHSIAGWRACDNPALAAEHVQRVSRKYG